MLTHTEITTLLQGCNKVVTRLIVTTMKHGCNKVGCNCNNLVIDTVTIMVQGCNNPGIRLLQTK